MLALDEPTLRAAFVNASRKEIGDMTIPDLASLDFDRLDYLGWRDRRIARRAYAVIPLDGGVTGVLLKQAEASPRSRAQCSWCQDVHLPNDVVFFAAKRAGAAGRKGDTLGTLVCSEFECSANVRKLPPMAYIGFDAEGARLDRMARLREHAAGFARAVLGSGD
jgi:hypothetical protein